MIWTGCALVLVALVVLLLAARRGQTQVHRINQDARRDEQRP